jgi:prepilin signal peptidase PulO-like enzyme (type II secretory pathway)
MEIGDRELWWIDALAAAWFFYLGAAIGSFCNVVAARAPRGVSFTFGGSRCPHCGRAVRARDNIPILSWLLLRGRCRDCGGRISPRYLLVELAYGAAFLALYFVDLRLGTWSLRTPGPLDWLANPASLAPFAFHAGLVSMLGVAWLMQFQGDPVPRGLWRWGAAVGLVGLYLFGFSWIGAAFGRGAMFKTASIIYDFNQTLGVHGFRWSLETPPAVQPLLLLAIGLTIDAVAGRARPAGEGFLRVFPAFTLVAIYLPGLSLMFAAIPPACFWLYRIVAGGERTGALVWTTMCLVYVGGTLAWCAYAAFERPYVSASHAWTVYGTAWAAPLSATALAGLWARLRGPAGPQGS